MRRLRPAGLLAGLILLSALPANSVAVGNPTVDPPAAIAQQPCGQPGQPNCPPPQPGPMIAIAKTAVPASLPAGGGPVTYTYTVTNPGPMPLTGVTVSDDKCAPVGPPSGDTNGNSALDPGETWIFQCTTTITTTTTNTATASGKDPSGLGVGSVAHATVVVATSPQPCPPASTAPECLPLPCPPGLTGPNCPPVPPAPSPWTTLVYECFDLVGRLDPNVPVVLVTKNFGNDTVLVRRSERMCEAALKTRTQPPTTTPPPVIYPNTEMELILLDPAGAPHEVLLQGPSAQQRVGGSQAYDTELIQLSLRGSAPLRMLSPIGPMADSFFDVFVDLRADSPGRAGSFFDIFTDISLNAHRLLGSSPVMLRPGGALRFINHGQGQYGLLLPAVQPIPLLDPAGQATGWRIAGGSLVPSPPTTPGQAITRVLECFSLERGNILDDPYVLRTKNFGADVVMVHRATRLCEGAIKSKAAIASSVVPRPAPLVWECFDIASARAFNPTSYYLRTRNFGLDPVRVLRPDSLCEEAVKLRFNANGTVTEYGQPTGRVLECFRIQGKNLAKPYSLRTHNWALDTVRIVRGSLLCEPAVKQLYKRFVGP